MKFFAKGYRESLSQKVLFWILLSSSLLTCIITVLQVIFDYNTYQSDSEKLLDLVESTYKESIAVSIWEYNEDQLQVQVDGILNIEGIDYVEVQLKNSVILRGELQDDNLVREFNLHYQMTENNFIHVGSMKIISSKSHIYDKIYEKMYVILSTQMIKTFISSFIIIAIVQLLVVSHLTKLKEFLIDLDLTDPTPFKFDRGSQPENAGDELSILQMTVNNMRDRLYEYGTDLERMVHEKTVELTQKNTEILTILESISQGIFWFGKDATIEKNYSPFLQSIFETNRIVGKRFDWLVLDKSINIGPDQKQRVRDIISIAFDPPFLNFLVNSENLPRDVIIQVAGKEKHLTLDWEPIVNDKREIIKIMVVIRDVTRFVELRSKNQQQLLEINIITQLVKMEESKFPEIRRDILTRFAEIRRLAQNPTEINLANILFSLHTLKGHLRNVDFSYIVDACHDSEKKLQKLKGRVQPGDRELILSLLRRVFRAYQSYKKIVDKLNFSKERSEVVLMQEIEKSQLETPEDLNNILGVLQKYKDKKDWLELDVILRQEIESAKRLAISRSHEAPIIDVKSPGILIHRNAHRLLKDIMTHMFTNSIDHGLEEPSERVGKGKSRQGKIKVLLTQMANGGIHIRYQDDGAGLNLKALRAQVQKSQQVPDGEIARAMFSSGVSTAESVTKVSGRGEGMAAVKQFITDAKGDITIILGKKPQGEDFSPFHFEISLPLIKSRPMDRRRLPGRRAS